MCFSLKRIFSCLQLKREKPLKCHPRLFLTLDKLKVCVEAFLFYYDIIHILLVFGSRLCFALWVYFAIGICWEYLLCHFTVVANDSLVVASEMCSLYLLFYTYFLFHRFLDFACGLSQFCIMVTVEALCLSRQISS